MFKRASDSSLRSMCECHVSSEITVIKSWHSSFTVVADIYKKKPSEKTFDFLYFYVLKEGHIVFLERYVSIT